MFRNSNYIVIASRRTRRGDPSHSQAGRLPSLGAMDCRASLAMTPAPAVPARHGRLVPAETIA
jgi:hypothetical protein